MPEQVLHAELKGLDRADQEVGRPLKDAPVKRGIGSRRKVFDRV